jgi:hypothetical protein
MYGLNKTNYGYLSPQKTQPGIKNIRNSTLKILKILSMTTKSLIDLTKDTEIKYTSELFKDNTTLNTESPEIQSFISKYLKEEEMINGKLYYTFIRVKYSGWSLSKSTTVSYRVLFFTKEDNKISNMKCFKVNRSTIDLFIDHMLITDETYTAIEGAYNNMKILHPRRESSKINDEYYSFNIALYLALNPAENVKTKTVVNANTNKPAKIEPAKIEPAIIKQYSEPQATQKAGYRRKKCGTKKKRFIKKY